MLVRNWFFNARVTFWFLDCYYLFFLYFWDNLSFNSRKILNFSDTLRNTIDSLTDLGTNYFTFGWIIWVIRLYFGIIKLLTQKFIILFCRNIGLHLRLNAFHSRNFTFFNFRRICGLIPFIAILDVLDLLSDIFEFNHNSLMLSACPCFNELCNFINRVFNYMRKVFKNFHCQSFDRRLWSIFSLLHLYYCYYLI